MNVLTRKTLFLFFLCTSCKLNFIKLKISPKRETHAITFCLRFHLNTTKDFGLPPMWICNCQQDFMIKLHFSLLMSKNQWLNKFSGICLLASGWWMSQRLFISFKYDHCVHAYTHTQFVLYCLHEIGIEETDWSLNYNLLNSRRDTNVSVFTLILLVVPFHWQSSSSPWVRCSRYLLNSPVFSSF